MCFACSFLVPLCTLLACNHLNQTHAKSILSLNPVPPPSSSPPFSNHPPTFPHPNHTSPSLPLIMRPRHLRQHRPNHSPLPPPPTPTPALPPHPSPYPPLPSRLPSPPLNLPRLPVPPFPPPQNKPQQQIKPHNQKLLQQRHKHPHHHRPINFTKRVIAIMHKRSENRIQKPDGNERQRKRDRRRELPLGSGDGRGAAPGEEEAEGDGDEGDEVEDGGGFGGAG